MATDPKGYLVTVAYEGGTVRLAKGLYDAIFGAVQPTWQAGNIGTTQLGRRRFKYGSRQRTAAAAGTQVLLKLVDEGVYSVRVTGDIIDFVDKIVARSGDKIEEIYTRRGTVYARQLPNL